MGLFEKKDDGADKKESSPKKESSFLSDPSGVDIRVLKSDMSSNNSGFESRGTLESERRTANYNSPWPSREEFAPFYESTTTVDVSLWKSVHRMSNEMPKLVTKKELVAHKSKIDAWMGLFGKVFDVSGFVDRHPGGYSTIEEGIGRDATEIFNKAHSYVDYESILVKDFVGIYMPNFLKRVKKRKASGWCVGFREGLCPSFKNKKKLDTKFDLKFTENTDYIVLQFKSFRILKISATPADGVILGRHSWTIILWDSKYLLVKTVLTPPTCWIAEYLLKQTITYEYLYVGFKNEFKRISILIKKPEQCMWNTLGEPHLDNNCSVIRADEIEDETLCHIFYRQTLSQNTILVGFKIRPSSFLGVPVGYSIRVTINGVSSWYTPVVFSLLNQPEPECLTRGESIYFIMKLTPEAMLSGMVNEIPISSNIDEGPGSYITMGCALGTFNINFLEEVDVLVLLTKGTGIVPMIRIVHHYLENDQGSLRDKQVILLYFNEKKSDIIWKDDWGVLDDQNEWFHVFLALEEADSNWDQLVGKMSFHLVKRCLETVACVSPELKMKGIASGDESFITASERVFNLMKDYFDKTFTFVNVYG